MDVQNHARSDQQGMGLEEALSLLWLGKWLMISFAAVLALVGGLAGWLIPNTYTASTILSPVSNASGGGQIGAFGTMASQLGGLASLAGLSGSGDSRKSEYLAVLQSESLTEKFISDNNLLPVIYYKKWNAARAAWNVTEQQKVPTLWKANQEFKKIRTVVNDSKTGLVTLTVRWRDSSTAALWANSLVALANEQLRGNAIAESERNIAFLNEEASKTTVVEVRQAVYKLLETEINKVMLARGTNEYAFKILDPAVAPEKSSNLPVVAWVAIGFLGGLFLSVPVLFLKSRSAKLG